MNPLRPNSETGFLESPSPNHASFDSAKKIQALNIAREMIARGEYPARTRVAKALGMWDRTLEYHLTLDSKFKEAWNEIESEVETMLVDTMFDHGRKPSGFMDRIALLRMLKPRKWNPQQNVQITSDISVHNKLLHELPTVIDAELSETPSITSTLSDGKNSIDDQSN